MTLTNEQIANYSNVAAQLGGNRTIVENFLTNVYNYSCGDKADFFARYKCIKEDWNEITYNMITKCIEMAFKCIKPDCKNCKGIDGSNLSFETITELERFMSKDIFKKDRKCRILSDDEIGE